MLASGFAISCVTPAAICPIATIFVLDQRLLMLAELSGDLRDAFILPDKRRRGGASQRSRWLSDTTVSTNVACARRAAAIRPADRTCATTISRYRE